MSISRKLAENFDENAYWVAAGAAGWGAGAALAFAFQNSGAWVPIWILIAVLGLTAATFNFRSDAAARPRFPVGTLVIVIGLALIGTGPLWVEGLAWGSQAAVVCNVAPLVIWGIRKWRRPGRRQPRADHK